MNSKQIQFFIVSIIIFTSYLYISILLILESNKPIIMLNQEDNIKFDSNLIITNNIMNEINSYFTKNMLTGNETILYLYGNINNNSLLINNFRAADNVTLVTTQYSAMFPYDSNSIMIIHNHPNNICLLSDGDIKTSNLINQNIGLYCYNKILWYEPKINKSYYYNITERSFI